jgi:hypothetical protein
MLDVSHCLRHRLLEEWSDDFPANTLNPQLDAH